MEEDDNDDELKKEGRRVQVKILLKENYGA
jgi:hypothetical protein